MITGNAANNTLDGGIGNDTLIGALGVDTFTIHQSFQSHITVTDFNTGGTNDVMRLLGFTSPVDFAHLTLGQNGADAVITLEQGETVTLLNTDYHSLTAASFGEALPTITTFNGTAGNDNLTGTAGSDILYGNAGNDSLYGGAGNDTLIGGTGSDYIDGGAGTNTVSYAGYAAYVGVDLTTHSEWSNDSAWDTVLNVQNVIGSDYNDYITGDAVANSLVGGLGNDGLVGGDGNDTLDGGAGDDQLIGGNGDDLMIGGSGSDYIDGGAGNDTVSYATSSTWVSSDLGGNSHWNGDAAWDNIMNVENIIGSNYADQLTGNAGDNLINGGSGNDSINGGAGNDTLIGGFGQDNLTGGAGNDIIRITSMLDSLVGKADVITDFMQGQDRIDVSALGFTAIDNTAMPVSGHLGEYISAGQTHLTDGHDFDLIINAALTLTNADIIHA